MRNLTKRERNAIEAVARSLSATWKNSSGPADVCLLVDGKRVAVEIATLDAGGPGPGRAATVRLRFDKVVTRLIERLRAALTDTIPDGSTVLLTVTAPIRLASKTAAAVEQKIQTVLRRPSSGRGGPDTIHGNRVQVRVVRHDSDRAPKVVGFVHNPDADPAPLLNLSRVLLERGNAGTRRTGRAGIRWLIVMSGGGRSSLEAYRYVHSQLRAATDFRKVVMLFGDGHVEALTKTTADLGIVSRLNGRPPAGEVAASRSRRLNNTHRGQLQEC